MNRTDSGLSEKKQKNISEWRERVDKLDRELVRLLSERQEAVSGIFSSKLEGESDIRDEKREAEMLDRIRALATEQGVDPYFAEKLFRDIIEQSLHYQRWSLVDHQNETRGAKSVRVSYQGVEGAFSNQAAIRHFSGRFEEIECIGYTTFEQAADVVESGEVDYAILPIENTTAGSINDTYDLLAHKVLH
ncbi:MAG: chorismate mutase, partial [Bacteroidota bacterium]